MSDLTHIDSSGNAVMVDVGEKAETARTAKAEGRIAMQAATLERIARGGIRKGDVLSIAQLAGIMGAKRTADLIPLCHPLALSAVEVRLEPESDGPAGPAVRIEATCRLKGRTGVEMEALTAVAVAALTVYDMCKAIDRGMTIGGIRLLHKAGGRSGDFHAA